MKLCINNLQVLARIGEHHWEKVIKQKIVISCQLQVNTIIDYCLIAEYIKTFVVQSHHNFIEELARSLHSAIKQKFPVEKCKIILEKNNCITNAKSAAVVIEE